jgi:hypothetical protein
MDATTVALVVALMGPTAAEQGVAVGQLRDGRFAYVQAFECRTGSGWLRLSDNLAAPYTLGQDSPANAVAAILCKHFIPGL